MWRSECRFRGVRRDHGCGVANANFPFPVRWPAMWGREENLSRWPTKGGRSECRFSGVRVGQRRGVVNADLVVSAATTDVGYRMQIARFLCDGQRCGVGRKDFRGGQQKGVGVNADLVVCPASIDVA